MGRAQDVHHGNGTQRQFEADPRVLTIDLHRSLLCHFSNPLSRVRFRCQAKNRTIVQIVFIMHLFSSLVPTHSNAHGIHAFKCSRTKLTGYDRGQFYPCNLSEAGEFKAYDLAAAAAPTFIGKVMGGDFSEGA